MARELHIVWAGRHQPRPWETLCAEYRRRIARHWKLRELPVRARRGGDGARRRRAEGEALRAALPDPCWTIALDQTGQTSSSEALAAELRRLRETWPHPVAFVIGSDLGLDKKVLEASNRRLSFGPMVFGHHLARLMLYEQLYRALAIERGIKYHRTSF